MRIYNYAAWLYRSSSKSETLRGCMYNSTSKFNLWNSNDEKRFNTTDSANYVPSNKYAFTRDTYAADLAVNKMTGLITLVDSFTTIDNSFLIRVSNTVPNYKLDRLLGCRISVVESQASTKQLILQFIETTLES